MHKKPLSARFIEVYSTTTAALLGDLMVFILDFRFLIHCRRWRLPSWQRTWRCSWSTRNPSLRRSRSLWLRTEPPERGRVATWNGPKYVASWVVGGGGLRRAIRWGACFKPPVSWFLPGRPLQAEEETGETEKGGDVHRRWWDPAGGDQPVQGQRIFTSFSSKEVTNTPKQHLAQFTSVCCQQGYKSLVNM